MSENEGGDVKEVKTETGGLSTISSMSTIPLLLSVSIQLAPNGTGFPGNESEIDGTADLGSSRNLILFAVFEFCVSFLVRLLVLFVIFTVMKKKFDPTSEQKEHAKKKVKAMLAKRGLELPPLDAYEMIIASRLVDPTDLTIGWADIGGLDEIIESTKKTILGPIIAKQNNIGISRLAHPPQGILLHGPPGCGKTSLAKAMAKESGCWFINLETTALFDKYYGESQKLTAAVFSLAAKLSPCMVFIDEIDSLLRGRSSMDHEVTTMMKAQFMSLWDGLSTDSTKTVILMGATNRPSSVDKAILRRMGAQVYVPLPGLGQRKRILEIILKHERLADEVSYAKLAEMTDGLSGSDMKEVARNAVVMAMDDSQLGVLNGLYQTDTLKYSSFKAKESPSRLASIISYLCNRLHETSTTLAVGANAVQYKFNSTKVLTMKDFETAIKQVKDTSKNYNDESDPVTSNSDPTSHQKKLAKIKANAILDQLGVKGLSLNDHELMIASHLVNPDDLSTSWNDIGGLDDVIEKIKSSVLLPIMIQKDNIHISKLLEPHKGILLYGPPGCGKTSLAKAVAKDAKCWFINLEVSILADKYYGESEKLTAAVFSVAEKLQPCIIFVDEIDSLLRVRNSHDHETTALRKAQFMSLWDGLITDPNKTIIVMGATNRPQDVDPAVLRRMSVKFNIPLPDVAQRMYILELILKDEHLAFDFNLEELAVLTDGFSGSDLKDVAKSAVLECLVNSQSTSFPRASGAGDCSQYLIPNQSQIRSRRVGANDRGFDPVAVRGGISSGTTGRYHLRAITMQDFTRAVSKVKESRVHCKL